MEGIHAAFTVRGEFIHAFGDPFRPVAGNYPDGRKLLWRGLPVKLRQDAFPMALRRPYNGIGVVVDDDCDVLMAFLIAGFVNADIYKSVQPSGAFRFDIVQGTVDASSYGLPVDAHIF